MAIAVKLNVFEGPLDLLLHLIEKNKIDIYDIPIATITDQYLEAIEGLEVEDMDELSEFLVMASTLLELKTRMLLPVEDEEKTENPADELAKRLIEYKLIKEIAKNLEQMKEEASKYYYKSESIPKEVQDYQEPIRLEQLLEGLDLQKMHQIFERLIAQEKDRQDPIRSNFKRIERDSIKLSDKIEQILEKCKRRRRFYFGSLIGDFTNRLEIIVTFLAVLELMKSGEITVSQEEILGDICIESTKKVEE